jgi:precorrin-6A synthase
MKKIYLTGIGPGELKYLTLQAVEVLKNVDLFLVPLKKGRKEELLRIRKEIIEGIKRDRPFRVIELPFPERKPSADYERGVKIWRDEKKKIVKETIENEMRNDDEAALLLWGEPALYDGHIDIVNELIAGGLKIDFEVIPGITSLQALTARHKIPLNRIGESILITTGRRLRELEKEDITNAVVLLDNYETYSRFKDPDLHIYWGAYLGNPDEVIMSGKLSDAANNIREKRRELKKKKGWIMETYILRRN